MRVLSDSEVPQLVAAIRPGEPFGERDQAVDVNDICHSP